MYILLINHAYDDIPPRSLIRVNIKEGDPAL